MTLIAAHFVMFLLFDLGRRPWVACGVLLLAFAAAFGAVRLLERGPAPPLRTVLAVAALLRLLLIPLPTSLSEDSLRYVWDGKVVAAGFDPYRLTPNAPELAALRDPLWEQMPHRDVPTVYPPLALALFAVVSHLPMPVTAIKILLSLIDLLGCALLYRLAILLDVHPARTLFYAWNPLVVLETAGMGHIDALMTALSIAAVWLLARGRPAGAATAAAGAVAAKLLPLLALPLWLRRSGRPVIFGAVAAALLVVLFLPLVLPAGGLPPGLLVYGATWEWNGPVFEPLWRLIDRLDLVPAVKSGLDRLKEATGRHEAIDPLYHWVYPQLLAKLCLLSGLGIFLFLLFLRPPPPAIAIGRAFGALLLASATVFPWYLIGILPWAALCRRRSWLLASALLPLAYLPRFVPGLTVFPFIFALVWVPVGILLLREKTWSFD